MTLVNVFNPVPPDWYEEATDLGECIEEVRNGNCVFWRIELHNPAWDKPRPDFGIFLPADGVWDGGTTPKGATLLHAKPGHTPLGLAGLTQHAPGTPDYPVVKNGYVFFNDQQLFEWSDKPPAGGPNPGS